MRERLKVAREAKDLTQAQMAHVLGYRSKSHYCMIENGQRGLSVKNALKLAEVLGLSVETLFFDDEVHVKQSDNDPTGTEGGE